ncbi:hypothetical protein V8C86DRAFT_2439972 [Haematococcus lacustris]
MMMGAQFQPDNSVAEHVMQDEHGNAVMLSQMVEKAMVEGYLLDQDRGRYHHHYCPKRKAMEHKGELFVTYSQSKRARALREMRWFGADLLGMAADEVVEDGLPWWHEGEIRKHAAKYKALTNVNNLP